LPGIVVIMHRIHLFGLPQATQIGTHNLAFTDQITSQSWMITRE
jgi:hypothetical protein